jgi:hypothetical protein
MTSGATMTGSFCGTVVTTNLVEVKRITTKVSPAARRISLRRAGISAPGTLLWKEPMPKLNNITPADWDRDHANKEAEARKQFENDMDGLSDSQRRKYALRSCADAGEAREIAEGGM